MQGAEMGVGADDAEKHQSTHSNISEATHILFRSKIIIIFLCICVD